MKVGAILRPMKSGDQAYQSENRRNTLRIKLQVANDTRGSRRIKLQVANEINYNTIGDQASE